MLPYASTPSKVSTFKPSSYHSAAVKKGRAVPMLITRLCVYLYTIYISILLYTTFVRPTPHMPLKLRVHIPRRTLSVRSV